jgi:hypothetical protein
MVKFVAKSALRLRLLCLSGLEAMLRFSQREGNRQKHWSSMYVVVQWNPLLCVLEMGALLKASQERDGEH